MIHSFRILTKGLIKQFHTSSGWSSIRSDWIDCKAHHHFTFGARQHKRIGLGVNEHIDIF